MNKKYLMNGLAALALVAGISSCVKDVTGGTSVSEEQAAKENAELQLGFVIPDGQTWEMASQVEAKVTVNGDFGTDYTVTIFENNPLLTGSGVVLDKTTVKSGNTATLIFSCPNSASILFASIKDAKGYTYVKPVSVENNKITAVFGDAASASRSLRAASSTNSHVNIPTCTVTNDYVQSFLTDAKEPTDANTTNNDANAGKSITTPVVMPEFSWGSKSQNAMYNSGNQLTPEELNFFNNTLKPLVEAYYAAPQEYSTYNNEENYVKVNNAKIDKFLAAYNAIVDFAGANGVSGWLVITKMPQKGAYGAGDYVTKFKITGTWDKLIGVLTTEEDQGDARTVYVSGRWTIPAGKEQRVGGGAVVVIVAGGEIVVPEGAELNFVNQARLVNAGGTISGAGTINVTNGVEAGKEGYNSGTISVGKFNQNFGTFFNYGTFRGTELNGGAGTSTFVNRGHMYISGAPKGSNSANLQIKNNCWFEATGEVAGKLIENASGAYFKAGALDLSSSEGGEGIGTYIAMDTNSSMVITGAVKLNSTLIYGPTSGESAYLEYDNINFLNVGETYPINGKLNVYVGGFTGQNASGYEEHWNINMAAGDRKPQVVGKAAFNTAPTDPSDCAPGFTPNIPVVVNEEKKVYTYAFEDQTLNTDYDLNDVVLKVNYHVTNTNAETGEVEYDKTKLDVLLVALGATYEITAKIGNADLFKEGNEGKELHQVLKVNKGIMVNTGEKAQNGVTPKSCTVDAPDKWNGEFESLPVSIHVSTTGKDYVFPNNDAYPHAVMIPVDWAWPTERTNVITAYPNFKNWATSTATPRADSDWYNKENAVEGKVVQNN